MVSEGQAPSEQGSVFCAMLSVGAVLFSAVVFGASLGFTSPAIDVMQDTVMVDGVPIMVPPELKLVVFTDASQGSLFGAIVNIGALIGALCGGPVSERIGRRGAILVQPPIYVLTWFGLGISSSFFPLLFFRFLLGVAIGLCTATVPTYINEVAPTALRGAFGASFQLAVVVGIMLAYLLGAYVFVVETPQHTFCQWRHLAFAFIVPSVALFVFGWMIPESPRYLASKGDAESIAAARKTLAQLRGGESVAEVELQEILEAAQQIEESGGLSDLCVHWRALSIGIFLMLIQQFSGVNAVIFFQDTIFQEAGMENPAALGFYVMVLQVIMTAISIPLMDTAGRKVLLLLATVGMFACCIAMVIFFRGGSPGWLAMAASFCYIAFFSLGLGPIPWLMMGEIFPGKIRSSASSIAAAVNWLCSFITTETVEGLKDAITFSGVFGVYGFVLALGTIYVVNSVPETKGRSLAELEAMLSGATTGAPPGGSPLIDARDP
eukprot:TRINITY_DN17822_c0_g1_i2.p1 TRINITY_DN17822_c0_g1~~TRINITY_DN17822_c0_g1_i2.p1  ORF type:complete len:541 (-),score=93.34 TRINITY_DN17822_c0_g1_i2:50-1528(-)